LIAVCGLPLRFFGHFARPSRRQLRHKFRYQRLHTVNIMDIHVILRGFVVTLLLCYFNMYFAFFVLKALIDYSLTLMKDFFA
jgi:DNA integrity scanning protein DisA with diadenylate cyclase activity